MRGEDLECSVVGEELEELFDLVLVRGVEDEDEAVPDRISRLGREPRGSYSRRRSPA